VRTDGRRPLSTIQRALFRLRLALRESFTPEVIVEDPPYRYRFACGTLEEAARAVTLRVKEEGTVEWLRGETRPDDVFYDIGANIGLYSVVVGVRLGPPGHVYAFEPHAANVEALLRNFALNRLHAVATVTSTPLDSSERWDDFSYMSTSGGSSGSQFGTTLDDHEQPFDPTCRELKFATTVDRLIEQQVVRPPDLVKIDVDGNELLILEGMRETLAGPRPPRAVQVEVNLRHRERLLSFMESVGFAFATRHDTMAGQRRIAAGVDPNEVAHNVIFRSSGRDRG
jgi:FkbM family methyltransferase